MSILFLTDLHIKVSNFWQLDDLMVFLKKWFETNQVCFIVVGGDTLDTHEKVCVHALNKTVKFLQFLVQHAEVFILVGNHDYINNGQFLTDEHWLNVLKHWPRLTVVDRVTVRQWEGKSVVLVPYVPPGKFAEALTRLRVKPDMIFAHQEFRGCRLGAVVSTQGDPWDDTVPVISGHIHERHSVGAVHYPGASLCHSGHVSHGPCLVAADGTTTPLGFKKTTPVVHLQAPIAELPSCDQTACVRGVGTPADIALTRSNPLFKDSLKRVKWTVLDSLLQDQWETHILRNLKTRAMKDDYENIVRHYG